MIAKSRCHTVDVTSHEKLLLAFYRSMPLAQQQDIDGLLFSSWTLPIVRPRPRSVAWMGIAHPKEDTMS